MCLYCFRKIESDREHNQAIRYSIDAHQHFGISETVNHCSLAMISPRGYYLYLAGLYSEDCVVRIED